MRTQVDPAIRLVDRSDYRDSPVVSKVVAKGWNVATFGISRSVKSISSAMLGIGPAVSKLNGCAQRDHVAAVPRADQAVRQWCSHHGEQYLHYNRRLTEVDTVLELVWELIRTRCYPEKPFRYTAFFACQTLEAAMAFQASHGTPTDAIWEIETEKPGHLGDMSLLRAGSIQAPPGENNRLGDALSYANAYWGGYDHKGSKAFGTQLWEVLLTPPIVVVRKIPEP